MRDITGITALERQSAAPAVYWMEYVTDGAVHPATNGFSCTAREREADTKAKRHRVTSYAAF